MPRIVHLIPSDGIGGVEIAARSILKYSQKNYTFNLIFIAANTCNKNEDYLSRIFFHSENSPIAHISAIKIILSINPDVLICSLWRTIPVGLFIKLIKPKIKLVYLLHSSVTSHILDKFFSWLMLNLCDAVWGDSKITISARISSNKNTRTREISFLTSKNPENVKENTLLANIVYWGRLHKDKGLERSIKFVHILVNKGCNVQFQIWGPDNGEQKKLSMQIKEAGIENNIKFMGTFDHTTLDSIAEGNAFYLQLSRIEGIAMSVVEAMQRSLVPIVTPVGGISEYCIDDENAILIDDINDMDYAVNRVINLLNNEKQYRLMQKAAFDTWKNKKLYNEDFSAAVNELF